jgi:hypothetical protein
MIVGLLAPQRGHRIGQRRPTRLQANPFFKALIINNIQEKKCPKPNVDVQFRTSVRMGKG